MNVCKKLKPEMARLLEGLTKSLDVDAAGFAVVNDDESIGYCALFNVIDYMEKLTVSKGIDIVGAVLATQKPIAIDDYPSFPKAVSAWVQVGTQSAASAPVMLDGKLVGALTALSVNKKRHFTQEDIAEIERYTAKVSSLLEEASGQASEH